MLQNTLGRTGRTVSTVGLGTWQLGADWGDVDEDAALDVLRASADARRPDAISALFAVTKRAPRASAARASSAAAGTSPVASAMISDGVSRKA